jgi:hypothetical protein
MRTARVAVLKATANRAQKPRFLRHLTQDGPFRHTQGCFGAGVRMMNDFVDVVEIVPNDTDLESETPVAISSDGRWIVSAGNDGIRLWDAATGEK